MLNLKKLCLSSAIFSVCIAYSIQTFAAISEQNTLLSAAQIDSQYQNKAERFYHYDFDINGDGVLDKIIVKKNSTEPTKLYFYAGMENGLYEKHSTIEDFNENLSVMDLMPRDNFQGLIVNTVVRNKRDPFLTLYLNYQDNKWVMYKFAVSDEDFVRKFRYNCLHKKTDTPYPFDYLNNFLSKDTRSKEVLLEECPPDPVLSAVYEITQRTEVFNEDFQPTVPPTYLDKGTIVESTHQNEDWLEVVPPIYLKNLNPVKHSGWIQRAHVKPRNDIFP